MADQSDATLLNLTADIVAAHVVNNSVAVSDLPPLIGGVHAALAKLGQAVEPIAAAPTPAVSVRTSVKPDHVVCLEDGRKMKMLKRHLATEHGMTPAEYRAKWQLPTSYPMVAPDYAARRKEFAIKIGLGRKPPGAAAGKSSAEPSKPAPKRAAAKRGRPRNASAAGS